MFFWWLFPSKWMIKIHSKSDFSRLLRRIFSHGEDNQYVRQNEMLVFFVRSYINTKTKTLVEILYQTSLLPTSTYKFFLALRNRMEMFFPMILTSFRPFEFRLFPWYLINIWDWYVTVPSIWQNIPKSIRHRQTLCEIFHALLIY